MSDNTEQNAETSDVAYPAVWELGEECPNCRAGTLQADSEGLVCAGECGEFFRHKRPPLVVTPSDIKDKYGKPLIPIPMRDGQLGLQDEIEHWRKQFTKSPGLPKGMSIFNEAHDRNVPAGDQIVKIQGLLALQWAWNFVGRSIELCRRDQSWEIIMSDSHDPNLVASMSEVFPDAELSSYTIPDYVEGAVDFMIGEWEDLHGTRLQ